MPFCVAQQPGFRPHRAHTANTNLLGLLPGSTSSRSPMSLSVTCHSRQGTANQEHSQIK